MKCVICKYGETEDCEITLTLNKNEKTYVFKFVPAQKCSNCGEEYVSSEVTKRVLERAEALIKNGHDLSIQSYKVA